MGHGRKIRAVGFNQQAVQGHPSGDVAQIGGIFKGEDAGKRNMKPHVQGRFGDFLGFGETVEHATNAARLAVFALLFQNLFEKARADEPVKRFQAWC